MIRSKSGRKTAKRIKVTGVRVANGEAPRVTQSREELCVFAFRLTAEERDAIHKAAGPAKASKFARALLVAAARNDASAVKAIMEGGKATE